MNYRKQTDIVNYLKINYSLSNILSSAFFISLSCSWHDLYWWTWLPQQWFPCAQSLWHQILASLWFFCKFIWLCWICFLYSGNLMSKEHYTGCSSLLLPPDSWLAWYNELAGYPWRLLLMLLLQSWNEKGYLMLADRAIFQKIPFNSSRPAYC